MTDNPALRQRGQDVQIVFYDGSATTVKGVIGLAETSAGEASQPFGDFGPIAWLDYDGDGQQIEFLEYTDEATGDRVLRRVTKRERVGTIFPTVKCNMSSAATVIVQHAQFDGADFASEDFAT